MKKLTFLLSFLMLFTLTFAQTDIILGEPYDDIGGKFKFYMKDGDHIYTAKVKDRINLFIQKIDKNSLKESTSKVFKDALTKDAVPFKLMESNGLIYVFYTNKNKDNTVSIYSTIVDYKTFSLKEDKKLILTIKGGLYQVPYHPLCKLFVSEDKSKFLIQYQKALPKDKMSEQTFGLHVFDNKLTKIGGGDILMPFRWDVMDDMEYSIGNDGNINIIGYNKNKEEYHLVTVNKDDNSINIEVTQDKNFSYFYEYAFNGDNQKYMAGFYRTKESPMQMFVIDFKNSKKYQFDIPEELIPYYKDKGKKANAIMALDAITQEDGGLLVIGQELYGVEVYGNWNNGIPKSYPSSTSYNFNDYYLIRVNKDGTLKWMKRINKENKNVTNSMGEYDGAMLKILKFHPRLKYNYIYDDEKHYLFFIDELKEQKGKMLCAYRVDDASGLGKYTIGFNVDKIDKQKIYHVKPNKIVSLGNQEFGIEAYKKKEGDFMIKMKVQ